MRPALLYHGGKWRLSAWIQQFFPPHRIYAEPYAGAMSVLLTKEPAEVEVANDLDQEVVNFFAVLRDTPEALIRAVMLTPYARAEFEQAYQPCDDNVERARRLYVRSWMGFGVKLGRWKTGFKIGVSDTAPNISRRWASTEHLWTLAERLRSTIIECLPALKVIPKYDTSRTLFYVDPPYLASTRSKWWAAGYNHDMSDADHVDLARVLHQVKGMVALSGYPSELYSQLYADWQMVSTSARNVRGQIVTECLWLSPNVSQAPYQSQFFEIEASELQQEAA